MINPLSKQSTLIIFWWNGCSSTTLTFCQASCSGDCVFNNYSGKISGSLAMKHSAMFNS